MQYLVAMGLHVWVDVAAIKGVATEPAQQDKLLGENVECNAVELLANVKIVTQLTTIICQFTTK